jgi:hypothetical protein
MPWWAVALPVIAFAALLLLLDPSASQEARGPLSGSAQFVERLQDSLLRSVP